MGSFKKRVANAPLYLLYQARIFGPFDRRSTRSLAVAGLAAAGAVAYGGWIGPGVGLALAVMVWTWFAYKVRNRFAMSYRAYCSDCRRETAKEAFYCTGGDRMKSRCLRSGCEHG